MIKADFTEYYEIVKDILENEEFQKRKEYPHHEDESVYEHSLKVSILAYRLAKKNGFDYRSAAIGGLLHDFYSEPWQNKKKKTKLFKDIITKHMFPLNITPPKYVESWIVTFADKVVSSNVLLHPTQYPKYLGIHKKAKTTV